MLVPEKTPGPSCVTSRPSDSVRMIASLKSERLKTPNEGSKPEFHLRWIRELVPINASVYEYRVNTRILGRSETIARRRRGRIGWLFMEVNLKRGPCGVMLFSG